MRPPPWPPGQGMANRRGRDLASCQKAENLARCSAREEQRKQLLHRRCQGQTGFSHSVTERGWQKSPVTIASRITKPDAGASAVQHGPSGAVCRRTRPVRVGSAAMPAPFAFFASLFQPPCLQRFTSHIPTSAGKLSDFYFPASKIGLFSDKGRDGDRAIAPGGFIQ